MSAAIKQIVTVQPGGLVEVRSPELHEGEQAQVTIIVVRPADGERSTDAVGGWRRYAGAIKGSDMRAADNEQIDADLAAEYGNGSNADS